VVNLLRHEVVNLNRQGVVNLIGFCKKSDGSIYTEVIKYSTLLERAKKRNEIFMKKLGIYSGG
jgi:hypothetical protein